MSVDLEDSIIVTDARKSKFTLSAQLNMMVDTRPDVLQMDT